MTEDMSTPEGDQPNILEKTAYYDINSRVISDPDKALLSKKYYLQDRDLTNHKLTEAIRSCNSDRDHQVVGAFFNVGKGPDVAWSEDRMRHSDLIKAENGSHGSATFQIGKEGGKTVAVISGNSIQSTRSAVPFISRHVPDGIQINLRLTATTDQETGEYEVLYDGTLKDYKEGES